MSTLESFLYDKHDGRVRLTLNRPEKLNAIATKMMVELNEAL